MGVNPVERASPLGRTFPLFLIRTFTVGRMSSFHSPHPRRSLWQVLFPAEVYQGTAAQNTKLLNFLRTERSSPIVAADAVSHRHGL